MTKDRILSEIRRTAADNDGAPLGMQSFRKTTGITRDTWQGKYWRRWSEALAEAGFTPNSRTALIENQTLVEHLAILTREHGRFPVDVDIKMSKSADRPLPHPHLFRKLGSVAERIELVRAFAAARSDFKDILAYLPAPKVRDAEAEQTDPTTTDIDGAVYMLKLGKHYKIGKSFRVPQRHREISIELPEKPDVIHVISTDDPSGIETYWHTRFGAKRTNGEWFSLTRDDIRAFKRRKFM